MAIADEDIVWEGLTYGDLLGMGDGDVRVLAGKAYEVLTAEARERNLRLAEELWNAWHDDPAVRQAEAVRDLIQSSLHDTRRWAK